MAKANDAPPKFRKVLKNKIKFVNYKGNRTGMLHNVLPFIWQWMQNILLPDEVKTWNNIDVVIEKGSENIIDWTYKQREMFMENGKKMDTFM